MLGAMVGDIIGSVHEFQHGKTLDFPLFAEGSRFTDDTVLTVAVADCLLNGDPYVEKFQPGDGAAGRPPEGRHRPLLRKVWRRHCLRGH